MTLRACSVTRARLPRLEPDPALAVPVQVILAFFRIELDGPGEAVSRAQGFGDREEAHRGPESCRFAPQRRR